MKVLELFNTLKLTSYIRFPHQFGASIIVKRDFSFQDELKCKVEYPLNNNENYNECISNGLSSNEVITNKWLYQMEISK